MVLVGTSARQATARRPKVSLMPAMTVHCSIGVHVAYTDARTAHIGGFMKNVIGTVAVGAVLLLGVVSVQAQAPAPAAPATASGAVANPHYVSIPMEVTVN